MTTPNPWDAFEAGGNYVEFKAIGDKFCGVILSIGAKTWPAENNKPARTTPQLQMKGDDGEEYTLTAGWALLIAALKKEAPNVGDHLDITLIGIGPKPKETKEWAVVVTRAGSVPTSPAVAPAPMAAPPAPAPVPAAGAPAGITPEQLAAMQAMSAPAPAWDSDPRVAQLRGMGIADEAIRSTLGL